MSSGYDLLCRVVLLCLIPNPCGRGEEWLGNEAMIGSSQLQYTMAHSQYMCVLMASFHLSGCPEVHHTTWHAHPSTAGLFTLVYSWILCSEQAAVYIVYCDGVMVVCVTAL